MKYPALRLATILIKILSIMIAVVGIIYSFLVAGGVTGFLGVFTDANMVLSVLVFLLGIVISIIFAGLIWAISDFFQCIMDIEENTRQWEQEDS